MDIDILYNRVRLPFTYDCKKHDLAPDAEEFATMKINEMTNNELLQAISWSLADILNK